jgi:anti-anti-sigma regulatory factor
MEVEKKMYKVKSIHLSEDKIILSDELSGVYHHGIQYYDLKNIDFINYTGMVNLLDFIKSLAQEGVQVQFVNVNEKIKDKIKSVGLEDILNCA